MLALADEYEEPAKTELTIADFVATRVTLPQEWSARSAILGGGGRDKLKKDMHLLKGKLFDGVLGRLAIVHDHPVVREMSRHGVDAF